MALTPLVFGLAGAYGYQNQANPDGKVPLAQTLQSKYNDKKSSGGSFLSWMWSLVAGESSKKAAMRTQKY
jgi:hypothetical protein